MDLNYYILEDILKKRKVSMVIFSHGLSMAWSPHPVACYLVSGQPLSKRIGDGLPLIHWLSYYGCKLLLYPKLVFFKLTGMLEHLQPYNSHLIEDQGHSSPQNIPKVTERLLERFPITPVIPVEEQILQTNQILENGRVRYKSGPRPVMERYFYLKIQQLCREYNVSLAAIRIPVRNDPLDHIKIRPSDMEKGYDQVPLIVLTLSELFPNLSRQEISNFYHDDDHFTPYGAKQYSRLISKAVFYLYNQRGSLLGKEVKNQRGNSE